MQLAHGLLGVAVSRGARLFEAEAIEFDAASRSVGVQLQNGRQIEARNVVLATSAHVQRCEPAATPAWYGVAASFDDVQFDRDDRVPARFLKP